MRWGKVRRGEKWRKREEKLGLLFYVCFDPFIRSKQYTKEAEAEKWVLMALLNSGTNTGASKSLKRMHVITPTANSLPV